MAVLGKRKARASESDPSASKGDDTESVQDIFRRHFEAQFAPLPEISKEGKGTEVGEASGDDDSGEYEDEEDEWGGLSEDEGAGEEGRDADGFEEAGEEEDSAVEVVDHSSSAPKTASMSKSELKAFMSSRPPDPTSDPSSAKAVQPPSSKQSSATLPEDAPSLLAQDLELRRLISESHLLAPKPTFTTNITTSTVSTEPKLFASGKTRRKATDLRMQALGSTSSIYKQEKMPMNMRKGMIAARVAGEARRRKEARENGVILEREIGGKKSKRRARRDDAVDRPGVGRLKGAQLRISERDVQSIENTRDTFGRRR